MKFKTVISETTSEGHTIYGVPVKNLIQDATFTDTIFLLLGKRMPSEGERSLLNAVLVSAAEHGIETPSAYVPRVSVASGNPIRVGIAAGILAIGDVHGGAGSAAAHILSGDESADEVVARHKAAGTPIPGFGHRTYKDEDPRATVLYVKTQTAGLPLTAFEKAYTIEAALGKSVRKNLPLNIDGAHAAAVLALGLPPASAEALFVLARTAGMAAHTLEEKDQAGPYHRLEPGDITT